MRLLLMEKQHGAYDSGAHLALSTAAGPALAGRCAQRCQPLQPKAVPCWTEQSNPRENCREFEARGSVHDDAIGVNSNHTWIQTAHNTRNSSALQRNPPCRGWAMRGSCRQRLPCFQRCLRCKAVSGFFDNCSDNAESRCICKKLQPTNQTIRDSNREPHEAFGWAQTPMLISPHFHSSHRTCLPAARTRGQHLPRTPDLSPCALDRHGGTGPVQQRVAQGSVSRLKEVGIS